MAIETIWVFAQSSSGVPTTGTLELLTKARSLGGTVAAFHAGDDADAIAGALGAHGASKLYTTGDLQGHLPGPPVAAAMKAVIDGGDAPGLILFAQTYEGRDVAGRVSVTAGVVEPRYPSFKGIMAAKNKPVDTVKAGDLGVETVGWAGAGQEIVDVAAAEARKAGEIVEDDGDGYLKIVTFLEGLKVI